MIIAAILSIIGKWSEAAIIAIEVPNEVTASDKLSFEAATRALDLTFLRGVYYKDKPKIKQLQRLYQLWHQVCQS